MTRNRAWRAGTRTRWWKPVGGSDRGVTKISDPATLGGPTAPDTQCFGYDGYQRMTGGWTPANADCASTAVGGAAPYSTGYTYNQAGLRLTETQHKTGGDTTTLSCYTKAAQPHTLTATTTGTSCDGVTATYAYDVTGNTTTRPISATTKQTLTWTAEGNLATAAEGGHAAGYLYDSEGNLLIRRATAGDGETVVYLGSTELHTKTTSDGTFTWAVRTYTHGSDGPVIAERTTQPGVPSLSWLAADSHGTSTLALDGVTQAITKRYLTPFGAPRGTVATAWPDDKGFLGKTADPDSGLTHLGARQYDPGTGRFLSVDPLLETDKPQTLNGYSYSQNNPVTFSDPTGQHLACGGGFQETCPGSGSGGAVLGGGMTSSDGSTGSSGSGSSSSGTGDGALSPSPVMPPVVHKCLLSLSTAIGTVKCPSGLDYVVTWETFHRFSYIDHSTVSNVITAEKDKESVTFSYSYANARSATETFAKNWDFSKIVWRWSGMDSHRRCLEILPRIRPDLERRPLGVDREYEDRHGHAEHGSDGAHEQR
ncbi:RHS repeat-associated core domain-containing protein [Nonomuraea sp. CA-141351]|uniref:RHS repeat-associated core domain-containing protein n=1 Tax=Nonomuraea sp. CA-141351 TaxID=3239996 RepID=UPI003D8C15BD